VSAGALVSIARVSKTFRTGGGVLGTRRSLEAVRDVSLDIARGETLALVGESGSGKTTLGRIVLRLLAPTAGTVLFDGEDVHAADRRALRALRRRMQIVFQDAAGSLNPRIRVGHAVREPLEAHRLAARDDADARVRRLFSEVGLEPALLERFPHELSGGQRQRVGIARALALEPEFLVLDEPVSALDVSVQAQVLNLLADLRGRHRLTLLFIAHDLAVVRHVADRVAVMYAGRIVEEAPADPLFRAPRHPYTVQLLAAAAGFTPPAEPIVLETPSAGCAYAPRCGHPARDARCGREPPVLRELETPHRVACHHADVAGLPRGER
jgi:oligopeptide/dipeptide ABC transporter ATP-binding protein